MLLADDFCPAFDVHMSCILTYYSLLFYAEFCMIYWEQTAKRHKWPASPASTLISARPLDKNLRRKRNIWGFDQRIATSSERLLVDGFNSILLCLSPFFPQPYTWFLGGLWDGAVPCIYHAAIYFSYVITLCTGACRCLHSGLTDSSNTSRWIWKAKISNDGRPYSSRSEIPRLDIMITVEI